MSFFIDDADRTKKSNFMHDPNTETIEQVSLGNLQYIQPKKGCRFGVDAVLLADFVRVKPSERLIDLGAGAGIISLLCAALSPAREIVGVELQERLAQIARRNVQMNHFEDRIRIVQGDVKCVAQYFQAGEFDVLCANPPYRKVGSGRISPHSEQAIARHELACRLSDIAAAAKYLVKSGGKAFFIYLPERMSELFAALREHQFEPKIMRCVHSTIDAPAALLLIEARRDAAPGMRILPPLALYEEEHVYSAEARQILRTSPSHSPNPATKCPANGSFTGHSRSLGDPREARS